MQIQTKIKDHFIPSRLAKSPKSETLTHLPKWRAAGVGIHCCSECTLVPTFLPDAPAPRPLSREGLHRCVHVHSSTIYKSKKTWRPLKYWVKERAKALILLGLQGTRTGECNGHPTDESRKSRSWVKKTDPGSSRREYHLGKDENLKKPDSQLLVISFVDNEIDL